MDAHIMLTLLFEKSTFVLYLSWTLQSKNVMNWEMNCQRLLDKPASHQCDCQKSMNFYVIVIMVSWVGSYWQPWHLMTLCCYYWQYFVWCTCSYTEFGYFQVQRICHCHSLLTLWDRWFSFVAYRLTFHGCIWILERKKKPSFMLNIDYRRCHHQDGNDVENSSLETWQWCWEFAFHYFFGDIMILSWISRLYRNFDYGVIVI